VRIFSHRYRLSLLFGVTLLGGVATTIYADQNIRMESVLEQIWEFPGRNVREIFVLNSEGSEHQKIGMVDDTSTIRFLSSSGELSGELKLSSKPVVVESGVLFGSEDRQLINTNPLSNRLEVFDMKGKLVGKHVTHGRITEVLVNDCDEDGRSEILLGLRASPGLVLFKYPSTEVWKKGDLESVQRIDAGRIRGKSIIFSLDSKGYISSYKMDGKVFKDYSAPFYLKDFKVIGSDGDFDGLVAIGEDREQRKEKLYLFDSRGFIRWERTILVSREGHVRILALGDVMGIWEQSIVLVSGKGIISILDSNGHLLYNEQVPGMVEDLLVTDIDQDGKSEILVAVKDRGIIACRLDTRPTSRFGKDSTRRGLISVFENEAPVIWTALHYLQMGNHLFRMDRLDSALDAFQKAVILNPELAISYANLAVTLIGLERTGDAEQYCMKAQDLNPYLPDPSAYLGLIQFERGYLDKSISLNLRAGSLSKSTRNTSPYSIMDRGSVHYNLACAYALKGRIKLALMHLEKAFKLNNSLLENAENDEDLQVLQDQKEFNRLLVAQ